MLRRTRSGSTGATTQDPADTTPSPTLGRALALLRSEWYLGRNDDVALAGLHPAEHFARYGFRENRSPNPLVDARWYTERVGDLPEGVSAVHHYLVVGAAQGIDPHPMFDSAWYLRQTGPLPPGTTPLEHYLESGAERLLDPHPLFDSAWYLDRYGDDIDDELTPFEFFVAYGLDAGHAPNVLFRPADYHLRNEDVAKNGAPAFKHFVDAGAREGRAPNPFFDAAMYWNDLKDDPAIDRLGPLGHYVHVGSHIGAVANHDPDAQLVNRSLLALQRRLRGVAAATWAERAESVPPLCADDPVVSVVIPTYGRSHDVVRCLESIAAAGDETPIEVIVVDDASPALDAEVLASARAVRLVRLEQNRGFSGAVDAGVDAAGGEFVLLLNNDTEVLPGWVDELVREFREHPGTGVAGSRIIRADFRLQEAGGIIRADGSGWQYGAGDDPLDWRYRTRRPVDYCSGASLLIPRAVWDEVGGFDERFSPAYYEDTDLCFAVRATGRDVVYVPGSIVFHNEGSSHGRDGLGAKKYQFRNRERFAEKWSTALREHARVDEDLDETNQLRRRDRRRADHVVVFDHRVPTPDQDSGSLRMYRILEDLVDRGFVVHLVPANLQRLDPWTADVERLGIEVVTDTVHLDAYLHALSSSLRFVLISRPEVFAQFVSPLLEWCPTVPMAYDMVDAHGERLRRRHVLDGDVGHLDEAIRFERLEAAAARVADVVVTLSDHDEHCIRSLTGGDLSTVRVPNVHVAHHADEDNTPMQQRTGLLFVGGYEHPPNVDAALHLVHDILPSVRRHLGDVPVVLAGSKPPPELTGLDVPGVTVTGWVHDLVPLYGEARLVVAPLRYGAGVKGKIGEALSRRVPTVTTSIGAEGMHLVPDQDILVADDAESFAAAIVRAYDDEHLWSSLRDHGAAAVEQMYGRESTRRRIDELVDVLDRSRADRR